MPNMDERYSGIGRRVQNQIREVKESKLYTPQNKNLVLEFVNTCKAKNLTDHRVCFYLSKLKNFSLILNKDFKKWDRKDVEFVMAELSTKNYSAWTLENHKAALKTFFRWLNGLESSDPAPKIVRWLSKEYPPSKIRREDLLTPKDIKDMLNATNNPMHKALLAVLYAGPRPGEIMGMRIKDVRELNGLIKIYVYGKMGKKKGERPLYLTEFLSEFKSWIRGHPKRYDPNAYLFFTSNGLIGYRNMVKIIERLAVRAGIMRYKRDKNGEVIKGLRGKAEVEGKRVWLYLFRHTAGTRYYGKYEGSYARRLMGHAAGSKMEAVYCHLNEQDIEARLLGKKMPEDTEPDIPTFEKETDELLAIGKAIKKLSQEHPEVINIEKLQGLLG